MNPAVDVAVDYDMSVWIRVPVPEGLPDRWPDLQAWADEVADAVLAEDADAPEKAPLLSEYVLGYAHVLNEEPASFSFLHLRHFEEEAVPAQVFLWDAEDVDPAERDAMLREICQADDPAAIEPPLVEPFTARGLGPGMRVLRYSAADPDGQILVGIRFGWFLAEHDLVIELRSYGLDVARILGVRDDLDELAHSIMIELDPPSSLPSPPNAGAA